MITQQDSGAVTMATPAYSILHSSYFSVLQFVLVVLIDYISPVAQKPRV